MDVKIYKDGKGNVVVTEDYFRDIIYYCNNDVIRNYGNSVLYQKYIVETRSDNYFLTKRFEHQPNTISWYDGDAICKVNELFKDTILKREPIDISKLNPITDDSIIMKDGPKPIGINDRGWVICEPEIEPWKIEVAFRSEGDYLTISEDGVNNRPWTNEEIDKINNKINNI